MLRQKDHQLSRGLQNRPGHRVAEKLVDGSLPEIELAGNQKTQAHRTGVGWSESRLVPGADFIHYGYTVVTKCHAAECLGNYLQRSVGKQGLKCG